MAFSLFGKGRASSAAVIDIASSSIGGSFVQFPSDAAPSVSYSIRVPIEFKSEEHTSLAMLRTLDTVIYELNDKGRPAFLRDGGSHPDRVFVSVGSPWQETKVETETLKQEKPFIFTEKMVADALGKRATPPEGSIYLQKELVATLLNGYETAAPQNMRAERADIVMLTSLMEEQAMQLIGKAAKRLEPTGGVLIAPFQSLCYAVLRAQYPHDKEFILMRVSGEATSMLFADRGLLINASQVPVGLELLKTSAKQGTRHLEVQTEDAIAPVTPAPVSLSNEDVKNAEHAWIEGVTGIFREFATQHALPRILFLVAEEDSMEFLRRTLDTQDLHQLWLSDEPLTIIPVISRLLSSLIKHGALAEHDVMLDLIVLFAQIRIGGRGV